MPTACCSRRLLIALFPPKDEKPGAPKDCFIHFLNTSHSRRCKVAVGERLQLLPRSTLFPALVVQASSKLLLEVCLLFSLFRANQALIHRFTTKETKIHMSCLSLMMLWLRVLAAVGLQPCLSHTPANHHPWAYPAFRLCLCPGPVTDKRFRPLPSPCCCCCVCAAKA